MDIKRRLIIYNTLTIIIPLIITAIIAFIFIFVSSEFLGSDINYNSFKKATFVNSELLNVTKDIAKSDNKSIEDEDFKNYLETKLSITEGKIIITKKGTILYSSEDMNNIDIANSLEQARNKSKRPLFINNTYYSPSTFSIEFKDNSTGSVIFLTPIGKESNILKKLILYILIVFFASYIIVSIIISYIFSRKILRPISLLKKATAEIKNGNLDSEIVESGDTEIRELCSDFEEMRIKLKDSIYMKTKYDDNRKMLVSSISHDLKTPLTSIEGYIQGILDGVANSPEKLEHYLKTINIKTKQIDAMINDLLLYSKLDLGQIPFNFEKTDIGEYFSYCVEESYAILKQFNIDIRVENNLKTSKYFMIDRERFRRVILNIIDNSKKYMDKDNGEITIFIRENKLSIIIEIRDNGSGIDQQDTNKIFNRFYRSDSARSNAKGSGLGLAIAKQIVEGHNGRIWANSHGSDGTSIIISLGKM